MPAPKRPNTAAATAAVRRRGDETAAARLRAHGWVVISPEQVEALPAELAASLASVADVIEADHNRPGTRQPKEKEKQP